MPKTILLTGATDGIGLETAKMLVAAGHTVLLHGRSPEKLENVTSTLSALANAGQVERYMADLSDMAAVEALAKAVAEKHSSLDVLINNAGILKTPNPVTQDGLDVRFAVNTLAPYLLTQRLLPLMGTASRVINLSSAAQRPVNLSAIGTYSNQDAMEAYAQSKLAITMWSRHMAQMLGDNAPVIIAVNPGSMLGSKMVKEGFGVAGGDIRIGADILRRLALDGEFTTASGQYFDNDRGQFGSPHPDALDEQKSQALVATLKEVLDANL